MLLNFCDLISLIDYNRPPALSFSSVGIGMADERNGTHGIQSYHFAEILDRPVVLAKDKVSRATAVTVDAGRTGVLLLRFAAPRFGTQKHDHSKDRPHGPRGSDKGFQPD
jgi:hypothetical protein